MTAIHDKPSSPPPPYPPTMSFFRCSTSVLGRSALIRPASSAAIIPSLAATTLKTSSRASLLQFRLSSTDSSSSPSSSSSSSSTTATAPPESQQTNQETAPTRSGKVDASAGTRSPPYDNPLLQPPWTLANLRKWEQEAYKKHGPNYVEKLSRKEARAAWDAARRRHNTAKELSAVLGDQWYEIMEEAKVQIAAERETQRTAYLDASKMSRALAEKTHKIWMDEDLPHAERVALTAEIRRQRKQVQTQRQNVNNEAWRLQKKRMAEIFVQRGGSPPAAWLKSYAGQESQQQ
ncbi:hypothetical protein BD289DRAFT_483990 [Coniella lustricola]|uniref:Uncharacterized protein n=1 Tax=Coniella lustricola TaxID=2025994 RepID=A0A2T3A3I8_9PEZI|nr:hypothetical protein BD289DRAFT_483990 [Coniella lustricola]